MKYDNRNFEKYFYYKENRPDNFDTLIDMAKGFAESFDLNIQRKSAAFVVGIYGSIENSAKNELVFFTFGLKKIIDELCESANKNQEINGVRDDSRQVVISSLTALWHSEIYLSGDPIMPILRLKKEVDLFSRLKTSYSQNVARSVTLKAYLNFIKNDFEKSQSDIDWLVNFFYKTVDDMKNTKFIGSSPCGDLHKTVGLLQICMAGSEWMQGKRQRESLWSPRKLLLSCPRVAKGLSTHFDRRFLNLLENKLIPG